ncbi:hypothetical protein FACS189451_03980 [Bacteroidia bacterium]|nr:hypothetical protein FACS189446_1780 [Bacteroidia bacterium]GHT61600.1 hypothetical protein FACS189451_03980 [Bacteroidia bacterium]
MEKSSKLTLGGMPGGIAALTKQVQGTEDKKKRSTGGSSSWERVIELATDYKQQTPKTATIYIAEDLKKDFEQLRLIPEFDKIPLTALTSAIIDDFLNENLDIIKESLDKIKSRF